jgi:hypothetical protein
MIAGHGITRCASIARRSFTLDELSLPDDMIMMHIPRYRRSFDAVPW